MAIELVLMAFMGRMTWCVYLTPWCCAYICTYTYIKHLYAFREYIYSNKLLHHFDLRDLIGIEGNVRKGFTFYWMTVTLKTHE